MMLLLLLPLLCGGTELGRLQVDLGSLETSSDGSDALQGFAAKQEHMLKVLSKASQALTSSAHGLPDLELNSMEVMLSAMASRKVTPGTQTFVSHVLNITEGHMKVSILSQLKEQRTLLLANRESTRRCAHDLGPSLLKAAEVRNGLRSLRTNLGSCAAALEITKMGPEVDPQCHLTALTCERAEKLCDQWQSSEDVALFDTAPDPDSSKCDVFTGYKSVGDYYKNMHEYWAAMVEDFMVQKAKCDIWAVWCQGNQSVCGIQPEPGPFPPCGGEDFPEAHHICGLQLPPGEPAEPPSVLACQSEQDELDRAACKQASMRLAACEAYKTCYASANATLQASWEDSCLPQGLLAALRHQYYGVLRIECLVHAISGHVSIDQCKKRSIHDYDLKMFDLADCRAGWIQDESSSEPDCKVAASAATDRNTPGTQAYKNFYYAPLKGNAFACVAECCVTPLENFLPLS
mmetsp:Transcript_34710/g.63049  ORF Transcript_34710/g.63049 Transcript_34710/m.63049 type:complete len:462 (+) Transcript_34710:73-1458(+)